MLVTIGFNFLFQGTLNTLFSAIAKLGIIVHMTLVSVRIPASAQIVFGFFL